MSHLLDDDELPRHRGDREVTLSTGAILGIFFGLTLLCGFFFAFGYNMGHKAAPAMISAAGDNDAYTSASAAYSSSKPSAGSLLSQTTVPPATQSASMAGSPPRPAASARQESEAPESIPTREPVTTETPSKPASSTVIPAIPAVAPSTGTFVVQVAAVSHQEDADLLVGSLQKKGYAVAARSQPGDKLVHVQVGPFKDHADADVMKQRLQTDGFHALIKQL